MTDGNDPSAQRPNSGGTTPPDPAVPAQSSPSVAPADPAVPSGPATPRPAPPVTPGNQDLPWKATAERRDLWGPVKKPLEGEVHAPGFAAVGHARRLRRRLFRRLLPYFIGGVVAVGVLTIGFGASLASPLIVAGAAVGAGVVATGGTRLGLRGRRLARGALALARAEIPESTRPVLQEILHANAGSRVRVAQLRPRASNPTATVVLDDVGTLLGRIDALAGTELIQQQRRSGGELTMLEGMATRYIPDLLEATEETIGFLATFSGSARDEALDNLSSIDQQLTVLGEGLERIERDIVQGVTRDLDVHAQFLRTRFADQHLNPIIDV